MKPPLRMLEFILDHIGGLIVGTLLYTALMVVWFILWITGNSRKAWLVLCVLLSSYAGNSQIVIGMGASAINFKSPGFNLTAGITFGKETEENRQKANYLYYSQTVNNARGDKPQVLALHYGRNLGSFQPYIGGAYHLATTDIKNNKRSGFKPAYGVTKYFPGTPIYLSLGRSGNINLLTVSIYTIQ